MKFCLTVISLNTGLPNLTWGDKSQSPTGFTVRWQTRVRVSSKVTQWPTGSQQRLKNHSERLWSKSEKCYFIWNKVIHNKCDYNSTQHWIIKKFKEVSLKIRHGFCSLTFIFLLLTITFNLNLTHIKWFLWLPLQSPAAPHVTTRYRQQWLPLWLLMHAAWPHPYMGDSWAAGVSSRTPTGCTNRCSALWFLHKLLWGWGSRRRTLHLERSLHKRLVIIRPE